MFAFGRFDTTMGTLSQRPFSHYEHYSGITGTRKNERKEEIKNGRTEETHHERKNERKKGRKKERKK